MNTKLLWHIAVPLVFLVTIFLFFPKRGIFEHDSDEGINLMKAMLVEEGYTLYEEVWSDQPPLFTYMLAGVIRIFGNKVGAARMLVMILSAVLIWACFQFLQMVWGNLNAVVGTIVLVLLPRYLQLSVSVMVGLPSITFAMLSLLALAGWHKHKQFSFLILSALALSLSILIKLFTGFLVPIIVVGLILGEIIKLKGRRTQIHWYMPAALWGVIFTIVFVGIGLLVIGPKNVPQLLETHLSAKGVEAFNDVKFTINWHLQEARATLYLSLAGVVSALFFRRWLNLYPFAWLITAYLLLLNHSPVWDHQQLLVTIPAAILSAGCVEWINLLINLVRWRTLNFLRLPFSAAILTGLVFLFLSLQEFRPLKLLSPTPSLQTIGLRITYRKQLLLEEIINYASKTHWVVTDMPMYAFRARLPVPPNLAVFSMKRFLTGNLTEQQIISTVKEYQPELILFGRSEYPLVEQFLENNYSYGLVDYKKNEFKLYERFELPP